MYETFHQIQFYLRIADYETYACYNMRFKDT